jgi:hypothetical protein
MLNRLLGIKSLENTEPVELEEVPMTEASQMPAEYDHVVPLQDQPGAVQEFDADEGDIINGDS